MMARNDEWIRVKIKNKAGDTICLYHPPKTGSAGQDVDRELRAILGISSPKSPGHTASITVEALPGPADWLTRLAAASEVPRDHCK
jgi:hypothetical protein